MKGRTVWNAWIVVAHLPWLALLGWLAGASWFLTDDAFISFRYARNLLEGHGLVFNPGEHVEGYTNFLWVLELAAVWGLSGIAPERAAPWLSVAFTAGTLAVTLWWVGRLPSLRHRGLVSWMALGLVCSSATFAAWTSGGGLETRQFTFFVVLAVACLSLGRDRRAGLLAASSSLAAAALTRPEGLLFAACCFGWFAGQRLVDTGRLRPDWREAAHLLAPFVAVVAVHFLFRYAYYGEWLPNTYHAKHVRPWYEAGFLYLWVAALETGLYLLLPLALGGLWARWRAARDGTHALVLLCVVLHAAYVARIGGDHFEWRPLDVWWPLLAVSASEGLVGLGAALAAAGRRVLPSIFAGRPGTRTCVLILFVPTAFYASAWQAVQMLEAVGTGHGNGGKIVEQDDGNAGWLLAAPGMGTIDAAVGRLRGNLAWQAIASSVAGHREFAAERISRWRLYERARPGFLPADAVTARGDLGIPSYYLPDLEVIDVFGLTDATVARHPVTRSNHERWIAHDRCAPSGYLGERGFNFLAFPPASSEAEALGIAAYAVRLGPGLWMPFEAKDSRWVNERFAAVSSRRPASERPPESPDAAAAVFVGSGVPVAGEEFVVRLSDEARKAGFRRWGPWTWERGSDAESWGPTWTATRCGGSFRYHVSADDVGYRLRANLDYADADGNWARATTPASAPVWDGATPPGEYLAKLSRLIVRSDWDVHLVGNGLFYVKDRCDPEDVAPPFFLHLDPADERDLPDHRKRHGFDSLDFVFEDHRLAKGKCVAWRALPDYDIVAVRTGQYAVGGGRIWEVGFDPAVRTDGGRAAP